MRNVQTYVQELCKKCARAVLEGGQEMCKQEPGEDTGNAPEEGTHHVGFSVLFSNLRTFPHPRWAQKSREDFNGGCFTTLARSLLPIPQSLFFLLFFVLPKFGLMGCGVGVVVVVV